ncbi:MAG: heavy-metal-associated domain-containing protein [Sphingomonadales bacterium]
MKFRAVPTAVVVAIGLALAAAVYAQIDGDNRGVAPVDSSGSFEASGIVVDVRAKTAEAARLGGWRIAQREGWKQLWAKTHGGQGGAPVLGDSALDGIVAGIVVENEQIGPNRYVATLGVLFDRARAGQILGVTGLVARSAPMLVVPVMWSGGTPYVFEQRTEWQKAWARFRTGSSPIDYVRVSGTGSDPLLLNFGQTQRPGRIWWRMILDQYGAADVLIPQVRLQRSYPGGPVTALFSARHGPDNKLISTFALSVDSSDKIPAMLDEGVRRMDRLYADALAMGLLRPDPSLIETPQVDPSLIENATEANATEAVFDNTTNTAPEATGTAIASFTVQVDTPDAGAVGGIESALRGVPGVRSATTTSLALGGVSVMSVSFSGDAAALKAALLARGFKVSEAGGALRIAR